MDTRGGERTGPVDQSERIDELDMLRGVALLGVLLANFISIAGAGNMATEAQLAALPTAGLDRWAELITTWLVRDKANTLFATLFGLGFYIQISRNGARPGFVPRFRRRLGWLLLFGIANVVLLWVWDILHLYALAGFVLLACRNWPTRRLVLIGATLALLDVHMFDLVATKLDVGPMPRDPYSTAVLERQAASQAGDYLGLVAAMARFNWADWLASGGIIAWGIYALGRFMLGASIGRSGVLDDIAGHLPLLRRLAVWATPLALALSLAMSLVFVMEWRPLGDVSRLVFGAARPAAALLQAAAYACLLAIAWHRPLGRRLLRPFQPAGQMALTNYLAQGLLYGFVLFGVGPGLDLAGRIGTFLVVLISLAFFAGQILFSRWWLNRYRFGPMEWLWRWLTYGGARPTMQRSVTA